MSNATDQLGIFEEWARTRLGEGRPAAVRAIAERIRARLTGSGDPAEPDVEVVVIGAGFGGLGTGVELQRAGIDDFLILDKNSDIGGTWHVNTYPVVAVDIPSVYYSFSYAKPKTWSRVFAPGAEVKAYADQVADSYHLRGHIVLDTAIVGGEWDEELHLWRVTTADGLTMTARYLIGAVGGLEIPKMPDIDGVEDFAGKVVHTSRWDHDYDYAGKRIAVIGTGATALQLIPELAKTAGQLTVFQRTPIWVMPKPDFRIDWGLKQLLDLFPPLRLLLRWATAFGTDMGVAAMGVYYRRLGFLSTLATFVLRRLHRVQLRDRELAARMTPDYAFGCKRPSVSNAYLKTFTKPNVSLITDPIVKITADAVVTADGTEHPIDVLVCATGFKVMEKGATPPFPLRGRDGLELGEFWDANRFQAYQGVSVPKFPNLFLIAGPYGYAGFSYIAMIECTSRHAVRAITESRRRGASAVEIKQEPHDRYYRRCTQRHRDSLWFNSDCDKSNTYYINYQGDAAAIRPSTHIEMWWRNKHFPLDDYSYSRRVA
ncbi:flavin-containing monooxygenase [Nocardia crassostreae]|uniref:flavin-containing monooxygenase n=1 Tax=Nocardia crassostreae TaxID=53428 RepID=UPI000A020201|nr:NAD(P)/FAD-dependent oxidoreductase [Nocardia crassostreae]